MTNTDTHVYPLNDTQEHVTDGPGCPCNPRIEVMGAAILYIHNAWDFREVLEEMDTLIDDIMGSVG